MVARKPRVQPAKVARDMHRTGDSSAMQAIAAITRVPTESRTMSDQTVVHTSAESSESAKLLEPRAEFSFCEYCF